MTRHFLKYLKADNAHTTSIIHLQEKPGKACFVSSGILVNNTTTEVSLVGGTTESSVLGRLSGSQLQHGSEREGTIREPVWPPLIGINKVWREGIVSFPLCSFLGSRN